MNPKVKIPSHRIIKATNCSSNIWAWTRLEKRVLLREMSRPWEVRLQAHLDMSSLVARLNFHLWETIL